MAPSSSSSSSEQTTSIWRRCISPQAAFLLVSLSLGQLGDGLNIFQGIYLVGIGWNEGSVGTALSLMGLTALLVQPLAGDWVDKATLDRRVFLTLASIVTALSASTILLVRPGNHVADHNLIYTSKVLEGIASSFIGPCLAALTLASFGPTQFDSVMASNIFWGHVGSVAAAVLAGAVSYLCFPDIQYCFLVIGASAVVAIFFVQYLPQGDPRMGRGFHGKETIVVGVARQASTAETDDGEQSLSDEGSRLLSMTSSQEVDIDDDHSQEEQAASYLEVYLDRKTAIFCVTGFFFHFANANVLLVLGELMGGQDNNERMAIPLTAGAIVTAQITMSVATWLGDSLTSKGTGRKVLFMAGIASLPIRCALILLFRNAGSTYLLSTQVLDGIGGGLMGLIQPIIVADITFGTGRFNAVMGLTASAFGLGATLSNYLGQMVVEHFGHVASLTASLVISVIPVLVFSTMPETYGCRGANKNDAPRGVVAKTVAVPTAPSPQDKSSYSTFAV